MKNCLGKEEEAQRDFKWLNVPQTAADQAALFEDIAPGSSLSMVRKVAVQPPVSVQVALEQPLNRLLPPLIVEVASAFLSKTDGSETVDSAPLMADIRGSVSEEASSILEEITREQSDTDEWKQHRYGRITASKAHGVRTFMGGHGGFGKRYPFSATKNVS